MNMNLTHLFEISNVANNPSNNLWIPDGYTHVKTIEFSGTMKCVIIRKKTVMRISFSSFTFQNIFNFLSVGYELVSRQEIVPIDGDIGMNAFFLRWSKKFLDEAKETIISFLKEKSSRRLILQGMSMGGAMSQCFYYHLMTSNIVTKKTSVDVIAFGSPRIGNAGLNEWFSTQKNTINYSVCIDMDGKMMSDPVCYFPSKELGYVNNHNLTIKHNRKIFDESTENHSSDITVSFQNFWDTWSFIRPDDLKVWDAVHKFEEYMEHL